MLIFALKTLLYNRGKFFVAVVGVVFSTVLVNVQGGMFLGMIKKASVLIDKCDADIWVGHRGMKNPDFSADILETWLDRIRSVPGVERAVPHIVALGFVRLPDGGFEQVLIVGSDALSLLGVPSEMSEADRLALRFSDSVTFDEMDATRLGYPEVGDVIEINGRRARFVAKTHGILGFVTTPYLFTNSDAAHEYSGMRDGYCSFFLVKSCKGVDSETLCRRIRERVPDLDVRLAEGFSCDTRLYWTTRTGIGVGFGCSTLLGLIVGLVMVAQSLYALVLDHLSEYAALKAIGADNRQIYSVLTTQCLTLALLGTTAGCGITYLIRNFLSTPNVPIEIHREVVLASTCLVMLICFVSTFLPFRRIRAVDPMVALQA